MSNNISHDLGQSVVPDLMKLYDSLSKSSTPQQSETNQGNIQSTMQASLARHPNSAPHNAQSQTGNYLPNVSKLEVQKPLPQELIPNRTSTPIIASQNNHQNLQQEQLNQRQSQSVTNSFQPAPPTLPPIPADLASSSFKISMGNPEGHPTVNNAKKHVLGFEAEAEKTMSEENNMSKSSRKKVCVSDGRWSKRFAWPEELHRDFVAAVFDVGLKHSSPSAILEQMPDNQQMTSERIKSHLQKYRLHRQKSKSEFMKSYDSSLLKLKDGTINSDPTTLKSGEVAAHLSFSSINQFPTGEDVSESTLTYNGGSIHLPQLTEDEKKSPLGASMGYLIGLFFSIKQQLDLQRSGKLSSEPFTSSSTNSSSTPVPAPSQGNHSLQHNSVVPATMHYVNTSIQQQAPYSHATNVPVATHDQQHSYTHYQAQIQYGVQGTVPITAGESSSMLIQQSHQQQQITSSTNYDQHPQHPQHWNTLNVQESEHLDTSQQYNTSLINGNSTSNHDRNVENTLLHKETQWSNNARKNMQLEESHIKNEMKKQMTFQNKLRQIKEQELSKYKSTSGPNMLDPGRVNNPLNMEDDSTSAPAHQGEIQSDIMTFMNPQGNGEDTGSGKLRADSMIDPVDFWEENGVDDQLFEFLLD